MALVTGAAKRLGRAVALRLAHEGADVAVHYGKSATEAHELVAEIEKLGRRAAAFSAELTNVAAIQKLIADVVAHFGRLDILVNGAANFLETKFGATTEATWDASLDTNLESTVLSALRPPLPTSPNPATASSSISPISAAFSAGANFFRTPSPKPASSS